MDIEDLVLKKRSIWVDLTGGEREFIEPKFPDVCDEIFVLWEFNRQKVWWRADIPEIEIETYQSDIVAIDVLINVKRES